MDLKIQEFWIRVAQLSKDKHLQQSDLADICGVSLATYRGWVYKGFYPNVKDAINMAKRLGTTVEFLVLGLEENISIADLMDGLSLEQKQLIIETIKAQVDFFKNN